MNQLSIRDDHFKAIKEALEATLERHKYTAAQYAAAGLPHKRYRWDMLHASTIQGQHSGLWLCNVLFPYVSEAHVDTALQAILGRDYSLQNAA